MLRLREIIVRKIARNFSASSKIDLSDEVRHAINNKLPVVALESTIITHGMPFPKNVECAHGVEKRIRDAGAVPATIAILKGRLTVGLSERQIESIGDVKSVPSIKTSRRDFAYVMGNNLNGGTTVSGTLIAADLVGISVFATGGIGGVHRMGETTMDVSADLVELGRTPVAVISSGVKSILDIPRTLEYLETQGVFVSTFGDSKQFPAFYTRHSGCEAPYNVSSAVEAARIIRSVKDLNLTSGMLFAVPVPEESALNSDEINDAISRALILAESKKITGKEITPFLLGHLSEVTKGKSLETNIALVQNNAKVAAQIAVALSKLDTIEASEAVNSGGRKTPVVIIGGSVLDRCATIFETDIKLDGRIHDGKLTESAGGVGRNICEALTKLSSPPTFITAIGSDESGSVLASSLPHHSIPRHVDTSSAQCMIVLDGKGDCRFLIGDMGVHEKITPEVVMAHEDQIRAALLIVLDGNPGEGTIETVLQLARKHGVPAKRTLDEVVQNWPKTVLELLNEQNETDFS